MQSSKAFVLTGLAALALAGCNSGSTVVTTPPPQLAYTQIDRLARPLVNELFASYGRHDVNNRSQPSDDPVVLGSDISIFMTGAGSVAQRSPQISAAIVSILTPDVIRADLSQPGPATYLGVETNGATGGKFGGRALTDDVVDISLGAVFGKTISTLGLAPDDGNANLATTLKRTDIVLTTDNVGPSAKHFQIGAQAGTSYTGVAFPYVGPPQ